MTDREKSIFYNGMIAGVSFVEDRLKEIIENAAFPDGEVDTSIVLIKLLDKFDFIRGDIDKIKGGN